MKEISKKGQVSSLSPAIIALVFAAIVLVLGVVVIQETTDTINDVSSSTVNESKTASCLNGTGCYLTQYTSCNFNGPSIYGIVNSSNNAPIGVGNATVNATGFVTNASTAWVYATKISYRYDWGDEACIAGETTTTGLGTFADFWEYYCTSNSHFYCYRDVVGSIWRKKTKIIFIF